MDIKIIQELEIALEKEVYKKSYYQFFLQAFATLHPGQPLKDNWHIKYLCDKLQSEAERFWRGEKRDKHLIINVPPRSAKSLIATICFPVWCWSVDPRMKFITASFAEDLAAEHSQLSKNIIISPWFQRLYGDKVILNKSINAKTHYATTEGGVRTAVGAGGGVMGKGADFILTDDIQDATRAYSDNQRQATIDYFNYTLSTRLNDMSMGVFINIQQRLHEEDMTGYLLDNQKGEWEHICIPAEYDAEIVNPIELKEFYKDNLFFRNRFTVKALAMLKIQLLDKYVGQFGQRPGKREGNIIKTDWFDIIEAASLQRDPMLEPIHYIIDPAYTEKTQNDPTGFISFYKRYDREEIVITHAGEVWKEFPDLIKFLKDYIPDQGYSSQSMVYMEPKASGLSIIQQLRQTTSFNVCQIESDLLKVDKVTRVNSITSQLQSQKVKLLAGSWNKAFVAQAGGFPKAKHDDMLDCLCYATDLFLSQEQFQYWML